MTLTPRSWNAEANSEPTAPAPMTTRLAGSSVQRRTSSLVTMRRPSGTRPGSDFTREPVARTMSFAVSVRVWPSSAVTTIRDGPSSRPRPATHSTLFLPTSDFRPVHMRFTTASLFAAVAA
ncbi:MAG: hypothetical protein U0838_07345 [Chloroflexota bacterium]